MNRNKETRLSGQTEQSTERQVVNEVVSDPFLVQNPAFAQPPQRAPAAEKYCKRCRSHGKDVGGRFLQDALHRPFWVCQRCCDKFDGRKGLNSLVTLTGHDTRPDQTPAPLYQTGEA